VLRRDGFVVERLRAIVRDEDAKRNEDYDEQQTEAGQGLLRF